MTQDSTKFPLWFTILTVVLIISNFFVFGLFTLLHPELAWPELGKTDAAFPIQFFAARHIAFAIPLTHGLIKKNATVLGTCYHIFLVLAVIDFLLLAIYSYHVPVLVRLVGELPLWQTLLISISCFLVPMGIAVKHLRKYK